MSELPGHDHDPDPAALDELQRAFADEPDVTIASPADREIDVEESDDHDDHDEADQVTAIVERVESVESVESLESVDSHGPVESLESMRSDGPGAEPGGASAAIEGGAPRVIRIDDYSGSAPIETRQEFDADATPESLTSREGEAPPGRLDGDEPADGLISIDDDELPDAVYVQGSLDADGSGTIVFIEDDDTGDVLGPESERDLRRGIEPRMRERRVAVKRAQGRRRLKRLAIVGGVVLLVVAVLAVLGSSLFAVREGDVEVTGARYTDEQRLEEIIDGAVGTPVLRLDTDAIESEIESIPWVDEASVSADFPHGLTIDIRERAAWTTYQGPDGRFRVLDRDGRVLDVLDMYPFAYVLVTGPDPVDLDAGEFAPQGYVAASELAKNLTGSMRGHVTMIEVTADGSRLSVHLDDGSTVVFGEARDLLAKLVRLESVLTNGQEREPGLIDVSTADVTR